MDALAQITDQTYLEPQNPDGSIDEGSLNIDVPGATGTYEELEFEFAGVKVPSINALVFCKDLQACRRCTTL